MNIYSACAWATIILHMVNVWVYAYWRGRWFDMRFHSISSTSIWMNYKCLWHGKRRTQSHKTHAVKQFCAFLFIPYRECIVCGNSNCAVWWHLTSYWALNSHIKAIRIALKEKHPTKKRMNNIEPRQRMTICIHGSWWVAHTITYHKRWNNIHIIMLLLSLK